MAEIAIISQDFCSLAELQAQNEDSRIDFKSISPWIAAQYLLGPRSSIVTSYRHVYGFLRKVSPDETRTGNLKISRFAQYTNGSTVELPTAVLDMDTNRIINLGDADMGGPTVGQLQVISQGTPHHAVNLRVGDQRYLRKQAWSPDEERTMQGDLIFGSNLAIRRNGGGGKLTITAGGIPASTAATITLDANAFRIKLEAANDGVYVDGRINSTNFLKFNTGLANAETRRVFGVRRLTNINDYIGTTYDTDAMTVGDVKAYVFQKGMVMMWAGPRSGNFDSNGLGINNLQGWGLCTGTSYTFNGVTTISPDLRNRFVIGASSHDGTKWVANITGSETQVGGSKDAVIVQHNHNTTVQESGAHNHTITDNGHSHGYGQRKQGGNVCSGTGGCAPSAGGLDLISTNGSFSNIIINVSGAHRHDVGVATVGVPGTDRNLPPYYALAYIIKL